VLISKSEMFALIFETMTAADSISIYGICTSNTCYLTQNQVGCPFVFNGEFESANILRRFSRVKWSGHEDYYPFLSSGMFKNVWSCTFSFYTPLCSQGQFSLYLETVRYWTGVDEQVKCLRAPVLRYFAMTK
jgi:hypothetical protein